MNIENKLFKKTRVCGILLAIDLLVAVSGSLIYRFAFQNDWLLYGVLGGTTLIAILLLILLLLFQRQKSRYLVSQINKLSQKVERLNNFEEETYSSDDDVTAPGMSEVAQEIQKLGEKYSRYDLISISGKISKDIQSKKEKHFLFSEDEMKSVVNQILDSASHFRYALCSIQIIDVDDPNSKVKTIEYLSTFFSDCVLGDFDKNTILLFTPVDDSIQIFKERMSFIMNNFHEVKFKKAENDILVGRLKVGIAIYPQSSQKNIFSDAIFALKSEGDLSLYTPKTREITSFQLLTVDSKAQAFFVNALKVKEEVKDCKNVNELNASLKKNMLSACRLFSFETCGYALLDNEGKNYKVLFEDSSKRKVISFEKMGNIAKDKMDAFLSYTDNDGSLFACGGKEYPLAIKEIINNLGIESFYIQTLSHRGQVVGFLYFTSSKKRNPVTFEEKEIYYVYSNGFESMISMILDGDIKDSYITLFEATLKSNEELFYSINKDTYEIVFASKSLIKQTKVKEGDICYKTLCGKEEPCPNCPIKTNSSSVLYDSLDKVPFESKLIASSGDKDNPNVGILLSKKKDIVGVGSAYIDQDLFIKNQRRLTLDFSASLKHSQTGHVLAIRIEDLKKREEELGKDVFKEILSTLSNALVNAGYEEELYRQGKDTFAFLFQGATRPDSLNHVEIIASILNSQEDVVNNKIILSYNLLSYPNDISNVGEFDKAIKKRLDEAKKVGEGYLYITTVKQTRKALRDEYIIDFIDEASKKGTIETYLQPIFNFKENRIEGAEVLLRLYDPNRGFIPPFEFVPLASRKGRMFAIEMSVLKSVGELYREYGFSIFKTTGMSFISMNISLDSLTSKDFIDSVKAIYNKYKFPKNFLHFEISERFAGKIEEILPSIIKELSSLGIYFALDNFTSTKVSVNFAKDFKFNEVKIDRDLVKNIVNSNSEFLSLNYVNEKLKKAGFSTTIEGIEVEAQLGLLRSIDFNYSQGYYYAKPMSVNDFIKYLNFGKI